MSVVVVSIFKMAAAAVQYYFRLHICWHHSLQKVKSYLLTKFRQHTSIHSWDKPLPFWEKRPSYWNSISGFDFDHRKFVIFTSYWRNKQLKSIATRVYYSVGVDRGPPVSWLLSEAEWIRAVQTWDDDGRVQRVTSTCRQFVVTSSCCSTVATAPSRCRCSRTWFRSRSVTLTPSTTSTSG